MGLPPAWSIRRYLQDVEHPGSALGQRLDRRAVVDVGRELRVPGKAILVGHHAEGDRGERAGELRQLGVVEHLLQRLLCLCVVDLVQSIHF